MSSPQLATYKGKTYTLLWSGKTKFGQRCKLAFIDGSKEFWADADLVTLGSDSQYRRSGAGRTGLRSYGFSGGEMRCRSCRAPASGCAMGEAAFADGLCYDCQ